MSESSSNAPTAQQVLLHRRHAEIEQAERALLDAIDHHNFDRNAVFGIRLAIEEALSNAFKHGNKDDAAKPVRLEWRVDDLAVEIVIEDQGEGFDPHSVPDPTEQENLEIPSGRGLKLMRAFMTEVQIDPPGNRVLMRFLKHAPNAG